MQTTKQLLDRAKKAQGIESDYKLAQVLGVVTSAVTNYRAGRSHPDDAVAARLAELAGQDPSSVIAELHAERAKTPEVRQLWLRMANQLRHAVAAVMLCMGFAMLLLAPNPQGAQASTSPIDGGALGSVHYVKCRARRLARKVATLAHRAFGFLRSFVPPLTLQLVSYESTPAHKNDKDDRDPHAVPRAALPAGV